MRENTPNKKLPPNNNPTQKNHKKIAVILAIIFASLILTNFLLISFIFNWADWVALLIFSLLFIVPAYISNASMVITGGGKPIDGGRYFRDGRRILGDHKTWNGLKGPLYIGIPISFCIFLLFNILWIPISDIINDATAQGQYLLYNDIKIFEYYFIGGEFPVNFLILIIRIILASYGAVLGDLIGSFLKRRFDIKSGAPFWIVDQLDFALVALLFASIPGFIWPNLFILPDPFIIIFLIILTPAVSIIANTVAYIIGLKDVPW
ncbi:MAG: CDP-2,3-bis-(O-geranylgeranyl)-sn-glycerol synthase [Promethearchaeota archaeon]|nr:MAG: CDP-2,3-bis-(O-geranylgeranyl)-sn-glycerol synthase [Candidatus Lokiarchaeota archaeon]